MWKYISLLQTEIMSIIIIIKNDMGKSQQEQLIPVEIQAMTLICSDHGAKLQIIVKEFV